MHPNYQYPCEKCPYRSASKKEIKRHRRTHIRASPDIHPDTMRKARIISNTLANIEDGIEIWKLPSAEVAHNLLKQAGALHLPKNVMEKIEDIANTILKYSNNKT